MSPESRALELVKGDTQQYELTFENNGAPLDITGWTIYLTVKANVEDPDASAAIDTTATLSNAAAGIALVALTPSQTDIAVGQYRYSFDYKDDSANEGTILEGWLTVRKGLRDTRE